MKFPWIRLPTTGLPFTSRAGTLTPTPKSEMISPRSREWEPSSTKPVAPLVWLPSMITRARALLPFRAGTWLGTEVM